MSDPVAIVKGTHPAAAGQSLNCRLLFAPGQVTTDWHPPAVGMLQFVTRKSIQYEPCVPGEVRLKNEPLPGRVCVDDADTREIDCPAPNPAKDKQVKESKNFFMGYLRFTGEGIGNICLGGTE